MHLNPTFDYNILVLDLFSLRSNLSRTKLTTTIIIFHLVFFINNTPFDFKHKNVRELICRD